MPEREMNPQADNPRRFRIEADADETSIEVLLPPALPKNKQPNQYKVIKKDIPAAARGKTYNNVTVKWINNYGIRLRGTYDTKTGGRKDDPFMDEVEGEQFLYEVIVPGPPPKGYRTLVYFDGTNVQAPQVTIENNNYHYNLNIGDPANGWGG